MAYVAATRARDLLVIPAVGDEERAGWIEPLNRAIYPPMETRRQQFQAPGCVEFKSKDSVLVRPGGSAGTSTVSPGLHVRKLDSSPSSPSSGGIRTRSNLAPRRRSASAGQS